MKAYWNNLSLIGKIKLIVTILILILLSTFIYQNLHKVSVNLFSFTWELTLSVLLLIITAFGFIVARLTDVFVMSKKNKEIKLLKKEIQNLKQLNKNKEV